MSNLESRSIGGYKINFDKYGDLQFPFMVYQYGGRMEECQHVDTHMNDTVINMQQYLEIDIRTKTVNRVQGANMYWPNDENDIYRVTFFFFVWFNEDIPYFDWYYSSTQS